MTICQQNRKIILNSMSNPNTLASLIDPLADKNQSQQQIEGQAQKYSNVKKEY